MSKDALDITGNKYGNLTEEHITPEVGDVWINKTGTKKYYIVSLGNNYAHCLVKGLGISTKYYDLFRNYTYLGKSKANIDDLFKTENE